MQRVIGPVSVIVLVVSLLVAFAQRPWDLRMGANEAARALEARLANGVRYRCEREEDDGSIAMDDVDYACGAVNRRGAMGYWIGTDVDEITEVLPSG